MRIGTIDHNGITEGSIWKPLMGFFFPIWMGTFFQQFYNTADTIIVGRFLGTSALAAVGATSVIVSLLVGFLSMLISIVFGTVYGIVSGSSGKLVDGFMMRIVDIIYSLPDMLMVVLLSVVLREVINVDAFPALQKIGTNMISMFIVFALLYWTGMARMVRGQILTVKQNEYILAARVSGAKDSRIIRRHILPNIVSVIIIAAALQIPSAIFTESFLSFIGLGVQAPMPSLGSLANEARAGITQYPYKLLFPAGMICLITLAFNLLGDGLRDAFDPKLRR